MAGGTMPKARSTTIPATITTATVALGPQGTACRRMTSGESTTSTVRSCDKESRGGIISVAAGKGCLATFAPPLDAAGNSVRGRLVARYLARALGLDMLASAPDPTHTGSVS